ncbi:MAG: AMP-binding protein [Xanthomonadales bacterium]|nr:AMP-binding protein [Xanthomonadales bacterium]
MSTLPARLAAQVRAAPDRPALAEGGRALDRAGLWREIAAMAARLQAAGVAAGDRVAVRLANGVDAVAAWYGAWLAGAVVVPLNPQVHARDLVTWLTHSGAIAVIGRDDDAGIAAACAQMPAPVHLLAPSPPAAPPSGGPILADEPQLDAVAPAAIVYTSGTTGTPKGVTLSHGNLHHNTAAIIDYLQLGAEDRGVTVLPFWYAYGASVLNTHLAAGAFLAIETHSQYPHLVVQALERHRATGFSGVPSTFALLLEHGRLDQADLSALRYLTQAGGAMAPALTRRLRAALPAARLFVMYGQTEASARLTFLDPDRVDRKPGAVGGPVAGVELAIRHADGSTALPGEEGEVWARGGNIMAGYWQAPEATAQVLRDGWLRTGDLGRIDEEGDLWLAGRRSDIIKTGAHRVHPVDVEQVIAELPGVREVAVCGVDDALLGQAVAALVVADPAQLSGEMAVKAHCRAHLPTYKIPRLVRFVDALPRTASGKIRRADLATELS